jgi:hypothetical protein
LCQPLSVRLILKNYSLSINFLANKKSENNEKNISWNIKVGTGTIGLVGTF